MHRAQDESDEEKKVKNIEYATTMEKFSSWKFSSFMENGGKLRAQFPFLYSLTVKF